MSVHVGATSPGSRNLLLRTLPAEERSDLEAQMQFVPIEPRDVIQEPGRPMDHVWFPLRGVISLLTPLQDGSAVETATVGNEGMVGVDVVLSRAPSGVARAIGQVPGEALRMPADRFRAFLENDGQLRAVLFTYMQALFAQIAQGVACNGAHSILERCARWLLEAHDRAGSDQFLLTHEFLSQMLAVRRASVTVAARTLQSAGLITYERGRITVLDRTGLEEASCECYRVVKQEYRGLFPER